MGSARDVVERYYDAFDRKDPAWKAMVTPDVRFDAPLKQARGAADFHQLTDDFLQVHKATNVRARFEDGDQVCSIMELDLVTPTGAPFSCVIAELATVRDGRIASFEIVYDPRDFEAAFGAS